jgi:uncharacterized membrane protein
MKRIARFIFVLISQNRQSEKDRVRSNIDYEARRIRQYSEGDFVNPRCT